MDQTKKQNRNRLRESRLTALGGMVRSGGIEQKRKRTHGHGQQCEDCRVVGDIRKINDNGKKIIKFKKKFMNIKDYFEL